MSVVPMSIGEVRLSGPGVPDEIVLGGDQRLVIHELPGGGRAIDVMGPQDRAIGWTGTFVGPDALDRALALDALRQSGESQLLLFETFQIDVLIERYRFSYAQGGACVAYEIRCQPVGQDMAGGTSDLDGLIGQGLAMAEGLVDRYSGDVPASVSAILPGLLASSATRRLGDGDVIALSGMQSDLAELRGRGGAELLGSSSGMPATVTAIGSALSGSRQLALGTIAGAAVGQARLALNNLLGG